MGSARFSNCFPFRPLIARRQRQIGISRKGREFADTRNVAMRLSRSSYVIQAAGRSAAGARPISVVRNLRGFRPDWRDHKLSLGTRFASMPTMSGR